MNIGKPKSHLPLLILLLYFFILPATSAAPPRSSPSISDSISIPTSQTGPSASLPNILHKRAPEVRYLGNGWVVHYHTFTPFMPSWPAALSLSHFWSEIATQVTNTAWMPNDAFLDNQFSLHMPLGPGEWGQALDLSFEVFNFAGPVTREFVLAVAVAMMQHTLKGFCGAFNARLSRNGGEVMWIVFRVKGLAELRALMLGET